MPKLTSPGDSRLQFAHGLPSPFHCSINWARVVGFQGAKPQWRRSNSSQVPTWSLAWPSTSAPPDQVWWRAMFVAVIPGQTGTSVTASPNNSDKVGRAVSGTSALTNSRFFHDFNCEDGA